MKARPGSGFPRRGKGGSFGKIVPLFTAGAAPSQGPSPLVEPLRRLQWLRQELDLWNEAGGVRPMPQPEDFGLDLARLKPSDVFWRQSA